MSEPSDSESAPHAPRTGSVPAGAPASTSAVDGIGGWHWNLLAVWLSQVLSISGFMLAMPFVAFYMQEELGVQSETEVRRYMALFAGVLPFSLAIASPIWGRLADRYGRKLMLLRANLAACCILNAMALAPSAEWLIALRALQGLFTGTISAAQTLVATGTPERRQGFALGTLASAVYTGIIGGQLVGGVLAEHIGYKNTFHCGGAMLLTAFLLVLLCVKETRLLRTGDTLVAKAIPVKVDYRPALPVLLFMVAMAVCRFLDMPIFPLFIQGLNGGLEGASSITGYINGLAGLGAVLAGLSIGRLTDRYSIRTLGTICAAGSAVAVLLMGCAGGLAGAFVARFLMGFFAGGLDPVCQVWLSRKATPETRGAIFGLGVSFRTGGWMAASALAYGLTSLTLSGATPYDLSQGPWAAMLSYRAVFWVLSFLFLGLIPILWLATRSRAEPRPRPEVG